MTPLLRMSYLMALLTAVHLQQPDAAVPHHRVGASPCAPESQ